jgi:hypothetical protein
MTSQWTAAEKLVEREQRRKLQEQEAQWKKGRDEAREKKCVEDEDEKWLREVEQANNRPNRGPSLPTFDENWQPK